MFCRKCGQETSPGKAFCTSCGAAAVASAPGNTEHSHAGVAGEPVAPGGTGAADQRQPASRSRKGLVIAAFVVVFVLMLGVGGLVATGIVGGSEPASEAAGPAPTNEDPEASDGDPVVSVAVPDETTTSVPLPPPSSEEGAQSQPASPPQTTTTSTVFIPETELGVSWATASSTAPPSKDSAGRGVVYGAANTLDGQPATAWRTPGDGIGETIELKLDVASEVTRVGLVPGYTKIDPDDGTDRFLQNRRIRIVKWTFDDGSSLLQEFTSTPEIQFVDIPSIHTGHVVMEIVATTASGGRDYAAVSEIVLIGRGVPTPGVDGLGVVLHVFPLEPLSAGSYSSGGHAYPATDIFAPTGTPFVAVTSGVVDEVSYEDMWNPDVDDGATKGGLWVAIIGDDGVRYYGSHLSAIAFGIDPGVRVVAGQLLGYVGNSGNARDTTPHVHFGISMPTFPGDWEARRGQVDPVPFLDAWRSGDAEATPQLDS